MKPANTSRARSFYLSTVDLHRLELACTPLVKAFGHCVYIVGSAWHRPDFRDVDVRAILHDDEFDRIFGRDPQLWSVFCYAVSRWLSADTGLPIDFQVQRMTEANEKHDGPRNPVGLGHRDFAGLGDATRFHAEPNCAECGVGEATANCVHGCKPEAVRDA